MKKIIITLFLVILSVIIAFGHNIFRVESDRFYLPFESFKNRRSIAELIERSSDGFGAYRLYGHKHAGLDIKGDFNEDVLSIGKGIVIAKWYPFPHSAVLIEYKFKNEKSFYASYVHLGKIYVKKGDRVNKNTKIGRLFNKNELTKSGFKNVHLHLEIRKTISDQGRASYSCKTEGELKNFFYDPLIFFRQEFKS